MFCDEPSDKFPLYTTFSGKEIVLIGILYLFMLAVTIAWLKVNEKRAEIEMAPQSVESVMFLFIQISCG